MPWGGAPMRTLRLGDRGRDVLRLHEFLRLQGYDLGEEDYYGYLTKYAVMQFQKEHGLVPDGIGGKQFFALAYNSNLPIRRRIHVVAKGEILEEIGASYNMGIEGFGRLKSQNKLFPGQRLLFFEREVWGITGQSDPNLPQELTGLIYSKQPEHILDHPCMLQVTDLQSELLEKLPEDLCGIYVAIKQIRPLQGLSYLKTVKRLRRRLDPRLMLWVELGPQIPARTLFGGVDYQVINKLVDRVILSFPEPTVPGVVFEFQEAEELLASLQDQIPPWKVLLKIPLYAVEWEISEGEGKASKFPYSTALSRAFRHGARLEKDEGGNLYHRYQIKGSQFHLYLPQLGTFGLALKLANRHNLAGVILDQLGMEDRRIWNMLFNYFALARL